MVGKLNPGSGGAAGPRREMDLTALARAFEIAQAQLELLDEIREAAAHCPDLHGKQECYLNGIYERFTTRLLGAMLSISEAACRTQARTPAELSAKASIWVGRSIPEPENDVLQLAESICRDAMSNCDGWSSR